MRILRTASAALLGAATAAPLAAQAPAACSPGVALPTIQQVWSQRPQNVLRDTLTLAAAQVQIRGVTQLRNVYNGLYNAPLYRLNPGDSVDVLVRNQMDSVTNHHFHGYVVTPLPDTGDNVVPLLIPVDSSNRYTFRVPTYQSEGLMWYHPHPHGFTAPQVKGGLAGGMIVGDLLYYFPDYADAGGPNERVMYFKADAGTASFNILGNGCTRLSIRPGQRQLWRIANMSPNSFLNLKLPGQQFTVLAWDGNRVKAPMPADSLFVPPGSRVEAVVTGWQRSGTGADSVQFYTDSYQTSSTARDVPVSLGWLVNEGTPVSPRQAGMALAGVEAQLADSIARLLAEDDVNHDTIHFQQDASGNLLFNGKSYDHDTVDIAIPFEQVQEWVLINETDVTGNKALHTFHIHQTDFVVTRINGVEQTDSVHLDNVLVGIHRLANGQWAGDTVTVRFKYKPIAAGPFVYHCHVLAHEDNGMMANVCVYDPATGVRYCEQWFPNGPWGTTTADASPSGGHAHDHGVAGGGSGGAERER
ncbi:MAG TPA: multicopper oxidase family protein [Longimicrobium sp.]|nr:multicopper oxidase family protein [Longimicrobium sp.]